MVTKDINFIYRDFGSQQVARNAQRVAEGFSSLNQVSGKGIGNLQTFGGELNSVTSSFQVSSQASESNVNGYKMFADALSNTKKSTSGTDTAIKGLADSFQKFDKQVASTKTVVDAIQGGTRSITTSFNTAGEKIKETTRILEDHRARFKMYLLSIMFFGFIIQRTFQQMATTTLSTFMKITEAQTTAGQAVTALSAHWEYLKFSVGEAIGAFIEANPWIIELIDRIADFAQQNGDLVAKLIILGIVFGGTLSMIGQFGLGISGITTAIKALLGAGGISGLTASLGALAAPLLLAAAAVGILWLAWQSNFLNIRQVFGGVMYFIAYMWESVGKQVFRVMGDGAIFLGNLIGMVLSTLSYVWEYTWTAMYRGASVIWNGIMSGLSALYNAFVDIVNGIIWVQNMLVEKTGFGEKWAYAQKVNIDSWLQDTDKMKARMVELDTIGKGALNTMWANTYAQTKAWETALEGVTPALTGAGGAMIKSGEAFNVQQEAKFKEAANWTPEQIRGLEPMEQLLIPVMQSIPELQAIEQPLIPKLQDFQLQPIEQPIYLKALNEASLNAIAANFNISVPKSNTNDLTTINNVTNPESTTLNITNSINVDKMVSDLDIDKLTRDISTKITDSLKSYGIGG